ncbi:hypothetical protein L6452_21620 [Arctium lappa]|uniref:Uncharacterized protein n=1 Tax=Arctium lappa TaxID=4217 RepID=A0ACB9AWX5_ARCLA|nr:hypothetical protein L6452_21620 [Arctium lappa]
MEILEDEATMPEGCLENESEEIDDLEALNPKDWMSMRMVEATIEYICQHEGLGAIFVFLTGWDEISCQG